ncbi:UvrD-helicase domain-containing protein [Pontiellaceae bacterium B12227]|nr:UvrD-helicase domain-containing protein [Pontiellaceae bacterium B12227]
MNTSDHFLHYAFCGQLVKCTERGYGFIRDRNGKEFFAHIKALVNAPSKDIADAEGRYCMFALGGDAFRYKLKKQDWESGVVRWKLLNTKDKIEIAKFDAQRNEELANMSIGEWEGILKVTWYIDEWEKVAKTTPKIRLSPDKRLGIQLLEALKNSENLGEYLRLLEAIVISPFYSATSKDYSFFCDRFFQPQDLPLKVFRSKKLLTDYKCSPNVLPLIREQLRDYIIKAEVVAIDLESNGEDVFQIGWKNAEGSDAVKGTPGLPISKQQLQHGVTKSIQSLGSPCLVGHNFIRWDWPILMKQEVEFPSDIRIWDTLIISWLLEPWKDCHALIVNQSAHQADADAAETYALFESQYRKLKPILNDTLLSIHTLVDNLHHDGKLLSDISGRTYPPNNEVVADKVNLYPESGCGAFKWKVDCRVIYHSAERNLQDPELLPDICTQVAVDMDDLFAKIISIVVSDASLSGVQVRLSMIPNWLFKNDLQRSLYQERHANHHVDHGNTAALCYLSNDLFRLARDDANHLLSEHQLNVHSPLDVFREWNEHYGRRVSDPELLKYFPDVDLALTGRRLIKIKGANNTHTWILRDEIGYAEEKCGWVIFSAPPPWLDLSEIKRNPVSTINTCVSLPRWSDGDASKLTVDRLFVSPDTENRDLYLADILHCTLNLLKKCKEDGVLLILAMRMTGDASRLQKHLASLSYTATQFDSPLRQLEYVYDHGHKVQICSLDNLPKYIQAASHRNIPVRIAIDDVPLHSWYCLLHSDIGTGAPSTNDGSNDENLQSGDDAGKLGSVPDVGVIPYQTDEVKVASKDVWDCISAFLPGWIATLTSDGGVLELPVVILDSRLRDGPIGMRRDLPWEPLPFYSLDELLDKQNLEIYDEICFPKRAVKDIPSTYEEYRTFLEAHWGYSDFREGPQQEAINALLWNTDDLLLRLPTGGGKSIVFHLPALLRSTYTGRLTVVVTPLRALMADQVEGLWKRHFRESVDFLSGGRDPWLNQDAYQGILDGRVKLLFVAPERFRISRFTEVLERRRRMDRGLEFIVFDEAHCVSEWGFEFRPDYLYAAQYIAKWFKKGSFPGNPHRLLLTSATVTQRNRRDLEKEVGLGKYGPYSDLPSEMPHPIQPFIRLNSLDVQENEEDPSKDPKINSIIKIISEMNLKSSAVIIFVSRRKDCHMISDFLNILSSQPESSVPELKALPFHAGLPEGLKEEVCASLYDRQTNVLVCTKAFGMGMDIPHIHACIHHRPPTYIEDYLQEVGRIGRDKGERLKAGKEQVDATLLYNRGNLEHNIGLLQDKAVRPPDLQEVLGYCAERSVEFPTVDKHVCLIPATIRVNGKSYDENQLTSCLFWLERAGVLVVEGRHPPFMKLSVRPAGLQGLSGSKTLASRIAAAVLAILNDSASVVAECGNKPESDASSSAFGRFVRGLKKGLLALISPSSINENGTSPSDVIKTENEFIEMSISISELTGAVGSIDLDELFAGLHELNKTPYLVYQKKLEINRYNTRSSEQYWELVQCSCNVIVKAKGEGLHRLSRKEFEKDLLHWYSSRVGVELHSVVKAVAHDEWKIGAEQSDGTINDIGRILLTVRDDSLNCREIVVRYSEKQRAAFIEAISELKAYGDRDPVEIEFPPRIELRRVVIGSNTSEYYYLSGDMECDRDVPIVASIQVKREVYRAINTTLRLARYSGIEIKETLDSNGSPIYCWAVGAATIPVLREYERYSQEMRDLAKFIDEIDDGLFDVIEISLDSFITQFDDDLRLSRLKQLFKLLEYSGIYTLKGSEDEWVTIVSLNSAQPLPDQNEGQQYQPDKPHDIQNVYAEMLDKHRLQELRAQCMILLSVMPMENRREFIDDYFEALTGDDIEKLLENVVGDVDDKVLQENEILQEILVHVRRERFGAEIDRLNEQQKAVCTAPYRNNLLVNAGPGSGKTHVLLMRCAHLIHVQGINPGQILVLAFNRAVVFEIRKRIRDLFRVLGYGSYVNRLDVSTFHSFSLRHQPPDDEYDQDAIGKAVHTFGQKMANDEGFSKDVSGGYRAILVDEFQDMNEDFFNVVESMVSHCAGGAMVIGDDDQDILTWNRRQWIRQHRRDAPEEAVAYFRNFSKRFAPAEHQLCLNYRSAPDIVIRACSMIAKVSASIGFDRMKEDGQLTAIRSDVANIKDFSNWDDGIELARSSYENDETIAVLCRSNRECLRVYESLVSVGVEYDKINVLGGEDLTLYQLRTYGGLLDLCSTLDQFAFVDSYVWKELIERFKNLSYADVESSIIQLNKVYELIRKECGRPRIDDLTNFIRETKVSDLERLKAHHGMVGWENEEMSLQNVITVSTVHKVKGLEYDSVIIMPSEESFPFMSDGDVKPELVDSAEEARLYYVAMTRARDHLCIGWGVRETSWFKKLLYLGGNTDGYHALSGSPKEVYIGWPGQNSQVKKLIQEYIKGNVCRGDQLTRSGRNLCHDGKCIARLSARGEEMISPIQSTFRISNIMRYTCGPYMQQNNVRFWDLLDPTIRHQGWCYTVLIENL